MASIFRQKYTVKDETGKTIRKQSKYWYIDYKTADGTRKRVKGFKDKAATAQLAAKLEREVEQAQIGIIDKYKDHQKEPLSKHLDDFKTSLLSKGDTEKHARLVYNRAKAVIESCSFVRMSDMSASKVQKYLAERRRGGLSIRSSNFHLQAVKQLGNWLVADRRMAENPLAYLKGQNPQTDIRHPRRALTVEELTRLIETTAKSPKDHKMSGRERATLYKLAATTGLRANELATLTWRSFDLSSAKPHLNVLAGYSKHRRVDIVPLRVDIAAELATWKSEQNAGDDAKVFADFNPNKGADMLKKDLARAEIEYVDAAGRYADFHALRHSLASLLNQSGVSPKVAQALLRHSTISLTMDTYTHIGLHDERAALDSLPKLPSVQGDTSDKDREVARRTGTDDLPLSGARSAYKPAYKKLTENAYFDSERLPSLGNPDLGESGEGQDSVSDDKCRCAVTLGNDGKQVSPAVTHRSRRDSNPRCLSAQRFSRPSP
jgi:site-specific recombinase XerD